VLPRERDLVLRRGQFLLEGEHVGVALQVGVVLGHGEQRLQGLAEEVLRLGLVLHAGDIDGLLARLRDVLEDFPLVLQIPLRRVDEVGDQVVPTLELNVDLGPGVLHAVLQADEAVVGADEPEEEENTNSDEDPGEDRHGGGILGDEIHLQLAFSVRGTG